MAIQEPLDPLNSKAFRLPSPLSKLLDIPHRVGIIPRVDHQVDPKEDPLGIDLPTLDMGMAVTKGTRRIKDTHPILGTKDHRVGLRVGHLLDIQVDHQVVIPLDLRDQDHQPVPQVGIQVDHQVDLQEDHPDHPCLILMDMDLRVGLREPLLKVLLHKESHQQVNDKQD